MTGNFAQGNGATTRAAPATHKEWVPLPYMKRASDFLKSHYAAGLPLKPGGRKTSITLNAFTELQQEGKARTMLVIAPLRVCRQVWRQEGAKWSQFRHLQFALLHGAKKKAALSSGADVYLINPEGVAWLCKQYMGRPLPFDVVTIDELTKFQNAQAKRHKDLRPRLAGVKYRWGLTGSLFAKGYMGVFGQQLILDDGAALGRYITHYRDTYFQVGFDGFSYDLLPGSEKRIIEKMAPYWFYMDEADYAQLPDVVDVPRIAKMSAQERAFYDKMKRDMILNLPEGEVTAANTGAVYSKLAQMANGAVYLDDRAVAKIHDLKLDMLEELLDELNGEPLLVGYEFQHDIKRIRDRFGDVPFLGKGTTTKQEDAWILAWNRNELPMMLAHPQSAGHGLNMQEGQACHIAWFSITWDWELFDQFIRRVRRSGNDNAQVFNHLLIVEDTMDDEKKAAVDDKNFTEGRLNVALQKQILRESQDLVATGDKDMVAKLSRGGDAQAQTQQPAQGGNGGWGGQPQNQQPDPNQQAQTQQPANGGWGGQPQNDTGDQRARIQEQIAPQEDRSAGAQAAFSGNVQQQTAAIEQGDYGTMADPNQQPDPNQQGGNGGWGGQPQNQQPAQEQPAQGGAGGWGGQPANTSGPVDRPAQGGWGGQPQNEAPFDGGQPAQQQSNEGGDEVSTASDLNKLKKPELIELVQKLQAGGAQVSEAGDVASGEGIVIQARAQVLSAVVASSPDLEMADLVDISRELMDFVLRG